MDKATAASLAKASNTGNVLLLRKQGEGQVAAGIGMGKKKAGVAQEAVSM